MTRRASIAETAAAESDRLIARWLGRVPYPEALALQARTIEARRVGRVPDTLLLLEHPAVITLGRSAHAAHVRLGAAELARRGIAVHEVDRGGDVTYHGPGQLVGYPILALPPGRRDARRLLRDLEQALIGTCADHGVRAGRESGLTGVWCAGAKIAAVGVHLSADWITSHGFALNVAADLTGFETIVPCGLAGRAVTALAACGARRTGLPEVAASAAANLGRVFGRRVEWCGRPPGSGAARAAEESPWRGAAAADTLGA